MPKIPQENIRIDTLVAGWQDELDQYYTMMREFHSIPPPEALMQLAAMTARLSEIRGQIVRRPAGKLDKLRTQEVDMFLTECDRQFKIWSRLISAAQLEHDVTRGY